MISSHHLHGVNNLRKRVRNTDKVCLENKYSEKTIKSQMERTRKDSSTLYKAENQ